MFYGLGSDGTVGANKSAVKMIAMGTELYAQAVTPVVRAVTPVVRATDGTRPPTWGVWVGKTRHRGGNSLAGKKNCGELREMHGGLSVGLA